MRADRRTVLRTLGTATAGLLGAGAAADPVTAREPYRVVRTETDRTLFDVVATREGPFVVGAEGTLLRRGEERYYTVFEAGPFGEGRAIYGTDVDPRGRYLFLVGEGGLVAEYDVLTGELTRHEPPTPEGREPPTYTDVGVVGTPTEGALYLGDLRGHIHYRFGTHEPWRLERLAEPPILGVAAYGDDGGLAVTRGGDVYGTYDGKRWERFGLPTERRLFDVAGGRERAATAGEAGRLYCFRQDEWHYHRLTEHDLLTVDYRLEPMLGVVGGLEGTLFEFTFGHGLERVELPVETPLFGAYVGGEYVLLVGGEGTVIER